MTEKDMFEQMALSVLEYDLDQAVTLARAVLTGGIEPLAAVENGFVPGIKLVGEKFSTGELFLPELIQAAKVTKAAMDILQEAIQQGQRKIVGRYVIGTVKGDVHDIGKNLLTVMLSVNGWEVYDLGVDCSVDNFVEKAMEVNADIIGTSALLTTTIPQQQLLIKHLEEKGLRQRFRIMVGGAAVEPSWASSIGADGFADNVQDAVALAAKLVER